MNRGRRGATVFLEPEDYLYFIELLKDTAEMWNIRVAAYCLMTNHYHLLVQTPEANLSRCMRHINGLYTQRYNRRHDGDGQLFRGRYKSILVDADSYLLELVKYIHRNPLRAGITDSLDAYVWSSHKGYVSQSEKWNWLYKDFILSMLTKSKQKEKKAYTDLMREEESTGVAEFFARGNLPAILGAEEFIDRVRKQFYKQPCSRGVPQSRILALPLDFIKQIVAGEYKTDQESLRVSRRGVFSEPRDIAIYLARKHSGKTLLEIGAEFNMSQYSSVSSVVNKMIKLYGQNKKIRKRVQGIEKILLKGQT
jgi:REP element-mobilizing transposase RayT